MVGVKLLPRLKDSLLRWARHRLGCDAGAGEQVAVVDWEQAHRDHMRQYQVEFLSKSSPIILGSARLLLRVLAAHRVNGEGVDIPVVLQGDSDDLRELLRGIHLAGGEHARVAELLAGIRNSRSFWEMRYTAMCLLATSASPSGGPSGG